MADPAAILHHYHARNFEGFIRALEEERDFEISALVARKPVEVILAIYESAREQRIVKRK